MVEGHRDDRKSLGETQRPLALGAARWRQAWQASLK